MNNLGAGKMYSSNIYVSLLNATILTLALYTANVIAEDANAPKLIVHPPGVAIGGEKALSDTELEAEKKLRALEDKRREVSMRVLEMRVKLIKESPELADLHKKIMALHRSLASKLDKNIEMKKLLEEADKLDAQIAAIVNEQNPVKQSK